MANETLLMGSALSLLAGLVYAYVGWVISRRPVNRGSFLAATSFVAWWVCLGALTALAALRSMLAASGVLDLPLHLALQQLGIVLVTIALLGLVNYLAYLFTGRSRVVVPLVAIYAVVFVLLQYSVFVQAPVGVTVGRWSSQITYQNPSRGGPLDLVLAATLLLPPIVGALAYLSLVTRVQDRSQRFRVLVVSLSILAWMGSALVANLGGLSNEDWWQLPARFVGLSAALLILFAYNPPMFMQRRLGIDSSVPDIR